MTGTAVYGTVRTVVWEDGGSNSASYPIMHSLTLPIFALNIVLVSWFLEIELGI